MQKNKYSIILPVRDGGEYVKVCVKSILAQSIQNFDLHILENKSTDGTYEWLKTLNDDRIKIYPAEVKLSIEENWARIKEIPKNEFITLIGHDDMLDEHYLTTMDALIKKHPSATLYQSHFRYIDASGSEIKKCRQMREQYNEPEYLDAILTNSLDTMGSGYMMRSKDYEKLGGISPYPNLLFADHELWIRLTGLGYMAVTATEGFSYRLNQSVSKLSGASKYIDAFFLFLDFLTKLRGKNITIANTISTTVPGFIHFYCKSLAHRLLKTSVSQRNNKTLKSLIKTCGTKANELAPGTKINLMSDPAIRLASFIDSNAISRSLYLLFRKFYSKPIYP
ncbi:MAG: glycosyltransferase family 2 protein [Bacteroidetes bacterium]|nr:glycosyltransferase family 2 protein [Bacteroidota bacterium]